MADRPTENILRHHARLLTHQIVIHGLIDAAHAFESNPVATPRDVEAVAAALATYLHETGLGHPAVTDDDVDELADLLFSDPIQVGCLELSS